MNQELLAVRMSEFAYYLGAAGGFLEFAMKNDEVLTEFVGRNVPRADLEELMESIRKVGQVFYNVAHPV